MKKFKVAILGIGGVGGYFGGKLAGFYQGSSEVEIIFIARGANAKAIKENGLKLVTGKGEATVHPSLVTDDASAIGAVDLLVCCTKAYSLEDGISAYRQCINSNTVILPLLNGVDSSERILKILPEANVCEGCVYVVSRLTAPGVITKTGKINSLYFGSTDIEKSKLEKIEQVLKAGSVNVILDDNILQTIWEKFFFISAMATITSFADKSIGAVLDDEKTKDLVIHLLNELNGVTDAKGINIPEDIVNLTLQKMQSFPYEATSSMHSDFKAGGRTEVDALTGYVVSQGKQLNIPTPVYQMVYEELKKRNK